jgi:hypothetical protein
MLIRCGAASTHDDAGAAAVATATASVLASDGVPPKAQELRIMHDWYQVQAFTVVDVFIKKADPANVKVDFTPKTLSVTVKLPNGADYR